MVAEVQAKIERGVQPQSETYSDSVLEGVAKAQQPVLQAFSQDVEQAMLGRVGKYSMDIEDVASVLGVSVENVRRRLKNEGEEFMRLRKRVRMRLAMDKLYESGTVENISCWLGYSEATVFCLAFKDWFGVTPGQFRKRLKSEGLIELQL